MMSFESKLIIFGGTNLNGFTDSQVHVLELGNLRILKVNYKNNYKTDTKLAATLHKEEVAIKN
jgi:hypothetical protein